MQDYFTARQLPDSIFLKEEAAHIIRHIFFKKREKECCEVWTREMLAVHVAPMSKNAGKKCQRSMCKHACACVKGDHMEEGPLCAN